MLRTLAAGLVLLAPALAQSDMLGVTLDGETWRVDGATNQISQVGPSGFTTLDGLASTPWGTLYTIAAGDTLVVLDRQSGVGVALGAVNLADVRALAFDAASGLLFVVRDGALAGGADALWTIDPVTLATQEVGSTGRDGLHGLAFDPGGALFGWDVGDGLGTGPGLVTVDAATGACTTVAPGLNNGAFYEFLTFREDGTCYVGSNLLCVVDLATGVESLVGNLFLSIRGLDPVLELGGTLGANYCAANANSTGRVARMLAYGSGAAAGPLTLRAIDLPRDQFGYFLVAAAQGFTPLAGGSQGNLCLSLPIGRFSQQIGNAGPAATLALDVDTQALPLTPAVAIQAGETWSFQSWYRDVGGTSNFTDGLEITFL
jgi:hypothetical protein